MEHSGVHLYYGYIWKYILKLWIASLILYGLSLANERRQYRTLLRYCSCPKDGGTAMREDFGTPRLHGGSHLPNHPS